MSIQLALLLIACSLLLGWIAGRYGRDETIAERDKAETQRDIVHAANRRIARKLRLTREWPVWVPQHRKGWLPDPLRSWGIRLWWRSQT